ncbi:MAG: efflux RND transporter permease subunit [Kiritimatiellae bacterium]|nr:efflux RND transporter permease subunit [Kiritimatiellia bacterium]
MILTDLAIRFRVAVVALAVVAAGAGVVAYLELPREGPPDITIPHVFITATYDGTSPEDIERLIAVPLEKRLNGVDGVRTIRSTCSENVCLFDVEFRAGDDIETARRRVKDKVDLARPDLPPDLDEPIIEALNFSTDTPVLTLALSSPAGAERLRHTAELLEDHLERVPGVRDAAVAGLPRRELRVIPDPARLAAYGVPLAVLLRRLQEENATVTAGHLDLGRAKFQVRVPGEFDRAAELRRVVLDAPNGRPIYLGDVADVEDTTKDADSISRLDGSPCVAISVTKRAGENTVALIRRLRDALQRFPLPADIRLTIVMDQSRDIARMLSELENNIATGFLLVVAVLLAAMGLRNAVLVGLAIPMSMLLTFVALRAAGLTLNMMVLFSLVLVVGMLVDNAIVIVENIYRLRTQGLTRHESARRGASEVAWPVITSTLTTVLAFVPLLFWPDVMGQFMGFLPRTVMLALGCSLFVGLIVNPAIASFVIHVRPRHRRAQPHPFLRGYEAMLRALLRRPGASVVCGLLFLLLSLVTYMRLDRGVELFPLVEPRNAQVYIRFPQGTAIGRTDEAARQIEALTPDDDVRFVLTTVGQAAGADALFGLGTGGPHLARLHIEFRDMEERRGSTSAYIRRLREALPRLPGADIVIQREQMGPPTGAPVEIEIAGDDFDTLRRAAEQVRGAIADVPGLVDLRDDLEDALPEIRFRVDRDRAALLGADTRGIGQFLRMSLFGVEAGRFRGEREEYDITVRWPAAGRNSFEWLDRLRLPAGAGVSVPVSSLGRFEYGAGFGVIHRKDQRRTVTISGNDAGRGVDRLLADVRSRVGALALPAGVAVSFTGENKEMRESGRFLARAFVLASAAIFVVLVVQFNSLLLPAVILSSVVLSLVGVMWGLILTRMRFGIIMTGLGVITLAGVVVNNAIVLVDCIQQLRAAGMPCLEAILTAGTRRFRPVLLTAVTTILGLIPMAMGWSLEIHQWPWRIVAGAESSAWWAPMAVAVIFGLAVATILTLGLVPAMYLLVASAVDWAKRRWSPEP